MPTILVLLLGIMTAGSAMAADPAPAATPSPPAAAAASPLLVPPGPFHGGSLYQRHVSAGLTCASCHKESPPSTPVSTATCLSCHGPYKALAARTVNATPNPHDSHQGQLPCESCHHIHMPSVNFCAQCHTQFNFQVP